MGYKQELLQKIQNVRDFVKDRQENLDQAMKVDRLIKVLEDADQIETFFNYFNSPNNAVAAFGSAEKQQEFKTKNQALLIDGDLPKVHIAKRGEVSVPNVDFEAFINALEESAILDEAGMEAVWKNADPKIRSFNLPMTEIVNSIKADADALFDENVAKALKESLDFANGEMVEKTGKNLVDDAIEANSTVPVIHAVESFGDFVKSQGLNENVVVNHNGGFVYINPELNDPNNIDVYKPFLNMKATISEEHQQKVKALNELINEQGLIERASGGESGNKEYGLMDYFEKQRALKMALTDHVKLQSPEEKRESLIRIDRLAKETQEITQRYDKVLNYIKENFDLDNINFPGNVYGGRPGDVKQGDIENWYPNLPPRYDFENAKAVVFLNGFTQLKAACQVGEVTIEEYMENPSKTYLKAIENISKKEDAKIYLPRSEENTLGKRLAHVLAYPSNAYGVLSGYGMVGGRGMEFITNTNPDKQYQIGNTIITNVTKDYDRFFNHKPDRLFGNEFEPDLDSIKNLFALGNQEDELYKLSNSYRDKEGNLMADNGRYERALKAQANVSIEQQYRNLMATLKDFATERKALNERLEASGELDNQGSPIELSSYSLGILLAVGREYFEDCMIANNLSVASIQDDALREEVTSFLIDPVGTLTSKYVKPEELSTEEFAEFKNNYKAVYNSIREEEKNNFFQKFNQFNQKPNGYNTGKTFTKCLDDNKGSWWERFRGKTSKQYNTLQRIAREASRPGSNIPADNKALYSAAIAYKNYKLPEGRTFNQLNSTEKRRIEFCNSIIEAYEDQKREAQAQMENNQSQAENNPIQVNENQPQAENNLQADFQNQLNQDLEPQNNINNDVEVKAVKAVEKDPPEDEGVQP
ncbi:MAG: hypothetical protein J6A47_08410 [Bacilli bacterium]|nr:hypothetical protein [Bacilli bacterium]